jgi:hypothetical protein
MEIVFSYNTRTTDNEEEMLIAEVLMLGRQNHRFSRISWVILSYSNIFDKKTIPSKMVSYF